MVLEENEVSALLNKSGPRRTPRQPARVCEGRGWLSVPRASPPSAVLQGRGAEAARPAPGAHAAWFGTQPNPSSGTG